MTVEILKNLTHILNRILVVKVADFKQRKNEWLEKCYLNILRNTALDKWQI